MTPSPNSAGFAIGTLDAYGASVAMAGCCAQQQSERGELELHERPPGTPGVVCGGRSGGWGSATADNGPPASWADALDGTK
jgi:hypothetical protein